MCCDIVKRSLRLLRLTANSSMRSDKRKPFYVERAKANVIICVLDNIKDQYNELLQHPSVRYKIPLVDGVPQFDLRHLTADVQARCLSNYQQPDIPGSPVTLSSRSCALCGSPREHLERTFEARILRFGSLKRNCCQTCASPCDLP